MRRSSAIMFRKKDTDLSGSMRLMAREKFATADSKSSLSQSGLEERSNRSRFWFRGFNRSKSKSISVIHRTIAGQRARRDDIQKYIERKTNEVVTRLRLGDEDGAVRATKKIIKAQVAKDHALNAIVELNKLAISVQSKSWSSNCHTEIARILEAPKNLPNDLDNKQSLLAEARKYLQADPHYVKTSGKNMRLSRNVNIER